MNVGDPGPAALIPAGTAKFYLELLLTDVLPRQIVRRRHRSSLSARDLARAARVSVSVLSDIEGRKAKDVRLSTLSRIAVALGTNAGELLGCNPPGERCDHQITVGHPHGIGECITMHWNSRKTVREISALFGLPEASVQQVLDGEFEIDRRRSC
jgi:DNA-binding Xre family transcriptional regulator